MLCVRSTMSILFGITLCWTVGAFGQDGARTSARPADTATEEGRHIFESRCAACHGLDGRGAERAPDIATRAGVRGRSDADLLRIIRDGIPTGGMPGFGALDEGAAQSLVRYLRMLQGKSGERIVAGDPAKGQAIFFEKGRCAECHVIEGKGGFLGSDLSGFAAARAEEEIREAITKPSRRGRLGGSVVVTLRDGSKISGVVRNEDNFSLQLQTLDGGFRLLGKTEVADIARQPDSLMPSTYGSTLAPRELDDLIAFLARTAGRNTSATSKRNKEEGEDED
jgi:cytochrome c oxidase cbb3-type subunit III